MRNEELIRDCEWLCVIAGHVLAFLTFAELCLVPGEMDWNRLIVALMFVSLCTNAFLVSAILSQGRERNGDHFLVSMSRTRSIKILGWFVGAFVVAIATSHWWAKH